MPGVSSVCEGIRLGDKEQTYDPPSQNDARRTRASQLRSDYHRLLPASRCRVFFSLSLPSEPVRTAAHPPVSSSFVRPAKASTKHCDATPRRFAILLYQDAEETMEHRRDSVSQESTTSSDHPEPERSHTAD